MNFDALTAFLRELTEVRGFSGCDCSVRQNGKELYRRAFGVKDAASGEKMQGDELFFLYSCTKPVTVVAGLQLLEAGKFLLTDPVSLYLPEFANLSVSHGSYNLPNKEPLRISHLFSMQSGYGYALTSPYIREVAKRTGGRCPTGETVTAMAKIPLQFEPGTHWLYGLSHDILALLIERVSGMPFSAYVKTHIFDPLGMTESTFRMTDGVRARMATQYRYDETARHFVDTAQVNAYVFGSEYESGGAGMISSVNDYIRFADALALGGVGTNGVRILSPASLALLRRDWLPDSAKGDVDWEDLRGYTYGLGVRVMADPVLGGSLSSPGEFGWNGTCGHYLLVDPEKKLSVFFAQHMLNSQPAFVQPRLRNIVYAAIGE